MPEMRKNPITGEWTIIATERAKRPHMPTTDGKNFSGGNAYDPNCFFCNGNEHTTPPEVLVYRENPDIPNTSGWKLRVVTNKFSALNFNEELCLEEGNPLKVCCYARGTAEVIIESPHHTLNTALYSLQQLELVLRAYKERYIALSKESSIQYIAMFKNNGSQAGASIPHPHSQIIATPIIPSIIQNEIHGAEVYFKKNKRCIYCDMAENEIKDRSRIIYENDEFVSFAPYASRSPFETWIMPKFHSDSYHHLTDKQLESLSEIWKAVLYKIYMGLDNPPYNYFIHTSPVRENTKNFYHWHMELIPKMTIAAGFELGTGMYINIAIPEQSAEYLRNVDI